MQLAYSEYTSRPTSAQWTNETFVFLFPYAVFILWNEKFA